MSGTFIGILIGLLMGMSIDSDSQDCDKDSNQQECIETQEDK